MSESALPSPELAKEPPPPAPRELPPAPAPSPADTAVAVPAVVPAPAPTPASAPALAPGPRWWERLAWYAGGMALSLVLVCWGLRVDKLDFHAPQYYDLDSILYLIVTRATLEDGFGGHWRNERMGAPGVQELHDFPIIDHLHFGVLYVLGKVVPEPAPADPDEIGPTPKTRKLLLVYNLYTLLTYPLTVLTAMCAFRVLGLSLPAAAVGGLLYAFLPYHQDRLQYHYFLAAYWVVPLALLPALLICRGDLPFFRKDETGAWRWRLRSWGTLGLVVLTAAVASAGAYYAFFTCACYAFAGLYAAVVFRSWRAGAAAGILVALVVAFGLLNHLPAFAYRLQNGTNPITARHPEECENYGLKLAHLLLPAPDHNLDALKRLRTSYASPQRPAEYESAGALGVLGVVGLVGLVALAVLPFRRRWPEGPLAGLALFLLLLATVGGFGSVFNLLVTAEIRGYNRIGVFLAFVCQFAALWWLDRFLLQGAGIRRGNRLRYGAWAAVLVLGILDQTPASWFGPKVAEDADRYAERFRTDARFFNRIERSMPPGSKVFCLPYSPFPEVPPTHQMAAYEPARGYVMTDALGWSFGAVKGREADAWQQEVAGHLHRGNIKERLKRIVGAGFDGLLVDARGFPPPADPRAGATDPVAAAVELGTGLLGHALGLPRPPKPLPGPLTAREVIAEVNAAYAEVLGRPVAALPEVTHDAQNQFFLDLRPFRDAYREKYPEAYAELVRREREWVAVVWLGHFSSPEPYGYADNSRFGPPDGTAVFVNPTVRDRTFHLNMMVGVEQPGVFRVRLSGLVEDEFDVEKGGRDWVARPPRYGVEKAYTVTLKPGRNVLRLRCDPPPGFAPRDYRRQCYLILNFTKHEG